MASLAVSTDFLALCSCTEATVFVKSDREPKSIALGIPRADEQIKKNEIIDGECDSGNVICELSSSSSYLAVCSGKKLSVWVTSDWRLVSSLDIVRSASKIKFTPKETHIVVADKSGDVYLFTVGGEESRKLILGHLSVIIDVLVTSDEKFIITCDRDEKIRVSHFPNSYNIYCFCLGHKEFVSSIKIVPHDESILVSGSGDGTIKFWNYTEGLELSTYSLSEIPPNIVAFNDNSLFVVDTIDVFKKSDSSSLVCLSITHVPKIILLFLQQFETRIVCKFYNFVEIKSEPACFCVSNKDLWILSGETEASLFLFQWCQQEEHFTNRQEVIEKLIRDTKVDLKKIFAIPRKLDTFEYMFKKRYDNVQEYLVKKKARIEGTLV